MLEVTGPDGELWYKIDIPILGTIRDCEPTDFGWRGIMPDDSVLEVRSAHPGVQARIPDHHLRWRSRDGPLVGADAPPTPASTAQIACRAKRAFNENTRPRPAARRHRGRRRAVATAEAERPRWKLPARLHVERILLRPRPGRAGCHRQAGEWILFAWLDIERFVLPALGVAAVSELMGNGLKTDSGGIRGWVGELNVGNHT
jgi:hypothetical protein